ncbi:LamG domain-containing protein [Spirosoma sp. KCTC 42546]|uniref:LamG domain-containing protein n=1 Tax=Spirosoma sp. KCTC 42546 TaxID=2520506 RepID=UPI001157E021|nr:LamG domain-containing protein [Spirosoma sp. KCTC 42546]QDK83175.1 LamG domain-containing protein [Spirosoma sp. KCTC 42546]
MKNTIYLSIFLCAWLFLCACSLIKDHQFPPVTTCSPVSGVVGCYSFSEGGKDGSGNNNTAQIIEAKPASDRFNNPNSAYQFNGINTVIYVDNIDYGSTITMACWVKADNLNQDAVIMYYGDPKHNGFGLEMSNGLCNKGNKVSILLGGVNCDLANSSEYITDTNWHHLVLVKKDKSFSLFVDGAQKLTVSGTNNEPTKRLNIGAHLFLAENNGYFSGKIDEVQLYNRALTVDEVLQVFLAH